MNRLCEALLGTRFQAAVATGHLAGFRSTSEGSRDVGEQLGPSGPTGGRYSDAQLSWYSRSTVGAQRLNRKLTGVSSGAAWTTVLRGAIPTVGDAKSSAATLWTIVWCGWPIQCTSEAVTGGIEIS